MKKKTFLITGGTGFIGSNISKLLVNKNHNVIILDNNYRGNIQNIKNLKKKIKFIKGDIRDKQLLNRALKQTDAVIHLAYINGTKYFYTKPILTLDIAMKCIINIIDLWLKYDRGNKKAPHETELIISLAPGKKRAPSVVSESAALF